MLIEYKNHKIFAFSDTHGLNDRLDIPKDADILICAGDCCKEIGHDDEIGTKYKSFLNWYSRQEAKLRIFVPGNHELFLELNPEEATKMIPSSIVLLEDSGIEFDGISFYGAVCRPWMFKKSVDKVPAGVDFLITHGPAMGHLDNNTGCQQLREVIEKTKPKYHIFGHIHAEGGKTESTETTTFYNVSMCDQLRLNYPLKDHCEYSSWLVKKIEGDIKESWIYDLSDEAKDKCLLSLRKNLINEMVLSHQEDYIDLIREFDDCLRNSLKEMYDRAHRIYQDTIKHQDDGEKIEVKASLYLGKDYPVLHPVQEGNRQQLWEVLCDGSWNVLYDGGISQLTLPHGAYADSFEDFTGMNSSSSNKLDGFDPELTKDLNLTDQFQHLYNHTDFALTDFIYVRDFYSEINVEIIKSKNDEE